MLQEWRKRNGRRKQPDRNQTEQDLLDAPSKRWKDSIISTCGPDWENTAKDRERWKKVTEDTEPPNVTCGRRTTRLDVRPSR